MVAAERPRLLIGLGAQKAGTTWLYAYFRDHPEVHVPVFKEVHYFNVRYGHGAARYAAVRREELDEIEASWRRQAGLAMRRVLHRLFPHATLPVATLRERRLLVRMHEAPGPDHQRYLEALCTGWAGQPLAADLTPDYDRLPAGALARIAADFPEARFLFVMRDPIARAWSNLKMHYMRFASERGEGLDAFLETFTDGENKHVIARSDYRPTLAALDKAIPADRRLILFYEEMFCDAAMRQLCEFLGIGFRPGRYDQVVHGSRLGADMPPAVRARLTTALEPVYREVGNRFGDRVPRSWERT